MIKAGVDVYITDNPTNQTFFRDPVADTYKNSTKETEEKYFSVTPDSRYFS